jgi:energy-coupling factor transporter ATP-binding protein EcfA2
MQLAKLERVWKQGEHVFVSGPTKSGKTTLARRIVDIRIRRGGHVVVFCMKPLPDPTILSDYADFDRWVKWRKHISAHDRKILLWPDVSKARGNRRAILDIQKEIFQTAIDAVNEVGHWTVQIDEGLYMTASDFLGMSGDLAMGNAIGRSGNLTYVTLTQRPAHIPIIVYGSAAHAFIGRTREQNDMKRLSELGPKDGSRALSARISNLNRHEFLWLPIAEDWEPEIVDMTR